MQKPSLAALPLLLALTLHAAPAKSHTVTLGATKRVPFIAADVAAEDKSDETSTLRVRPLLVDGKLKEWTTGDLHEITERTFVIRRVLHVNDTLPGEKQPRWVWQPGPWLTVDRTSGRISALHMTDFDAAVSDAVWYRDYAAYCGVKNTARSGGLTAVVWQLGARKAALDKVIAKWPQPTRPRPVCTPAVWQREPMRITLGLSGATPTTFDVIGLSTNLVEEGEAPDDDQ